MRKPARVLIAFITVASAAAAGLAVGSPRARVFDSQRAFRDLVRQCDFGPRVPGTEAHDACARWLVTELRASGGKVSSQGFTQTLGGRRLQFTNIVAVFEPKRRGALKPADIPPTVLLAAHWDSRPTADNDPDMAKRARPVPGANDGASGVAVLLEIARALKAAPPKGRVVLVLFDGEDYGKSASTMFVGSRYFATHYAGPPVDWAVLLDMVGDRDLRIPKEAISLDSAPRVVERVWGAAARAKCSAFVPDRGPAVLDDHVPLLRRGIPCADVIDFDYPYWHTTADTPDKCSAASLGQVGRAVLRALAEWEAGAQKGQ